MQENHPAWLQPHPVGFIPDLTSIDTLVWLTKQLENKRLSDSARAELEALRKKAEAGLLTDAEARDYRRRNRKRDDSLASILAALIATRRRAAPLAAMPPDALTNLDASIEIIKNALRKRRAGKNRDRRH